MPKNQFPSINFNGIMFYALQVYHIAIMAITVEEIVSVKPVK